MEILLLRHGMTAGNQEHRYVGSTDEPLSREGIRRLREAVRTGVYTLDACASTAGAPVTYASGECAPEAYVSDAGAPVKFLTGSSVPVEHASVGTPGGEKGKVLVRLPGYVYVSPLCRCLQTADILFPGLRQIPVADLRECDFGRFEYRNYAELNGDPDYQRFIDTGGFVGFPGGEDRQTFSLRCVRAFDEVLGREAAAEATEATEAEVTEAEGTEAEGTEAEGTEAEADEARKADRLLPFVVHGGTIMAILDHYSDPHRDYYDWQVPCGEGYRASVIRTDGGWRLTDIRAIARETDRRQAWRNEC